MCSEYSVSTCMVLHVPGNWWGSLTLTHSHSTHTPTLYTLPPYTPSHTHTHTHTPLLRSPVGCVWYVSSTTGTSGHAVPMCSEHSTSTWLRAHWNWWGPPSRLEGHVGEVRYNVKVWECWGGGGGGGGGV